MRHLVLYGRVGCHLCEDMALALEEFRQALQFDVTVVDVGEDPALRERYGTLVPVLALGEREICHYFLDLEALKAVLGAAPDPGTDARSE